MRGSGLTAALAELERAAVSGDVVPAVEHGSYVLAETRCEHQVVEVIGSVHRRAIAAGLAADLHAEHASVAGFRFHDLRHTGQTLAASTGATVKDLMRRLGHASPAASNRYLHAVEGRDAEIALALSELAARGNAARLPKSIVAKH
jgi:hypothetical protein